MREHDSRRVEAKKEDAIAALQELHVQMVVACVPLQRRVRVWREILDFLPDEERAAPRKGRRRAGPGRSRGEARDHDGHQSSVTG